MTERLVYVCDGGDCSEKGSVELFEKLKDRLTKRGVADKLRVRKYPCFGGCEHGVNITVWPDRVFYSTVSEKDLDDIAAYLAGEKDRIDRLTGKVEQDVEEIVWQMLDSPY